MTKRFFAWFTPNEPEPDESWRDREPIRIDANGTTYQGKEIDLDDPKWGFTNVQPATLPDEVVDDVTGRQSN